MTEKYWSISDEWEQYIYEYYMKEELDKLEKEKE